MEELETKAIRLIANIQKNLYLTPEVLKYQVGTKFDKIPNIEAFLNKLEDLARNLISKNHISFLRESIYAKYIIKKENIPESFYELKKRILLEKGYGHIEELENYKDIIAREVINNQKMSLDKWLDYFLRDESNIYPFWAKYWAFQGMVRIGAWNNKNNEYITRRLTTTAPFIELNKEALSLTIESLIKSLKNLRIADKQLEQIVKTGSFLKIYTYFLKKVVTKDKKSTNNTGIWVRYLKGSNPKTLVSSIEGYNTNWCTVALSVAKSQLERGDFYIFFTTNSDNEYKIPRIAIRMEDENIAEIRGIEKDQGVEPEMIEVLEKTLQDYFPNDKYYKKLADMKKITDIYNKNQTKQELSISELRFLYQLDEKIIGFGYDGDTRILEIIKTRNIKKDLSQIFNCQEGEVATSKEEINLKTKVYYGNIEISENNFEFTPNILVGNIKISNWKDRKNIYFKTEELYGDIEFEIDSTLENVTFPKRVYGSLKINFFAIDEAKLVNILFPDYIKKDFEVLGAVFLKDSRLPENIEGKTKLFWFRKMENVLLPLEISEDTLNLPNIKDTSGLIIPECSTYNIETRYDIIEKNSKENKTLKIK